MNGSGFRPDADRLANSPHFLIGDKILDAKTYRLRLIMGTTATLVTCTACLSRMLLPFAALSWGIYSLVCQVPNAVAFVCVTLPSFALGMTNAWLSHDIYKRIQRDYFDKPELVHKDDAFGHAIRRHNQEQDLLFSHLRACFVSSRENIWFRSLALEATHASPFLKSWKAFCAGLQLGWRHNALRSFRIPSCQSEQIVFRLDNAGYRSPIRELDFYGVMKVTERMLRNKKEWTGPSNGKKTCPSRRGGARFIISMR